MSAFCASSPEAQTLSEYEFWARVYDQGEQPEYEPDEDDYPEMVVGFCLRCGGGLVAEDYQQLRRIIDEDREICDDCADDQLPDAEEAW